MNFFKKLFFRNQGPKPSSTQRKKLDELLRPLVKKAVRLNVGEPQEEPSDSNFKSQFGGMPYLENQSDWPTNKAGKPLAFVFQIFNDGYLPMPNHIKLLQFFYDFEEFPWTTDDDGWKLRLVEKVDFTKAISVEKPNTQGPEKYCEISFEEVKSLPDWDGINSIDPKISDLCEEIDDDDSWQVYEDACMELTGDTDYKSLVGGYPKWIQSDATPIYPDGTATPFLLQIDSEENADLMWGDSGSLYFFYNPQDRTIDFELQCF